MERLTPEEIFQLVGPLDDTAVSEVQNLDASREELLEARAEIAGEASSSVPSGHASSDRINRLVGILRSSGRRSE